MSAAMVMALVALTLAFGTVSAARTTGTVSAELVVSPNPVLAYNYFHGQGCGYVVGKAVNLLLSDASSSIFFPTGVDANGCISFDYYSGAPGSYVLQAYQNLKGKQQTLVASTTFTTQ